MASALIEGAEKTEEPAAATAMLGMPSRAEVHHRLARHGAMAGMGHLFECRAGRTKLTVHTGCIPDDIAARHLAPLPNSTMLVVNQVRVNSDAIPRRHVAMHQERPGVYSVCVDLPAGAAYSFELRGRDWFASESDGSLAKEDGNECLAEQENIFSHGDDGDGDHHQSKLGASAAEAAAAAANLGIRQTTGRVLQKTGGAVDHVWGTCMASCLDTSALLAVSKRRLIFHEHAPDFSEDRAAEVGSTDRIIPFLVMGCML